MKCNNCIHQEICALFDVQGVSAESPCSFYKDKELFLELPCKVGDTVYAITCDVEAFSCVPKIEKCTFDFPLLKYFGKTVFPTEEEAQKKLKEREIK